MNAAMWEWPWPRSTFDKSIAAMAAPTVNPISPESTA
jgi:hypothetical protein